MNILCLGDIVGQPGRDILTQELSSIQSHHNIDFTVANIENAAAGFGFNQKIYNELLALNIDAFTSGNHVYAKRDVMQDFDSFDVLVRPLNFPKQHPGTGVRLFDCNGCKIALINIIGRVFMNLSDCPFKAMDDVLKTVDADIVLVDFHAETTSEKQAMGWFLDGKVNVIFGTHTHVQTADCRVLSKGTGYVSDIGMCGAYDSVIGMDKTISVQKFITQLPDRHQPVKNPSEYVIGALIITIEDQQVRDINMMHKVYSNEKTN